MTSAQALRERSVFLIVVGVVLLMPPLILIADQAAFIFGIPTLYAYVFACWAALIAGGALLASQLSRSEGTLDAPADGRD
ncbi:MAG: hypothetical protein WCZ23_16970 [Rhodospirillaceae bacterium]